MDNHFDTFDFIWRCLDAAVPLALGAAVLIYFPRRFAREIEMGKRSGEAGRKLSKGVQILSYWVIGYGLLKMADIFDPGISLGLLFGGVVIGFFWWLSGYDPQLTGEGKAGGLVRRAWRCVITYVLVGLAFKGLWQYVHGDVDAGWAYLAAGLPLAILWYGCLSNLGAHGFLSLLDTADTRPFDPREEARRWDEVSELIRTGRKAEAIKMCEQLKDSDEVDILTLELVLEHLGVSRTGPRTVKPLTQAEQLRAQGQFRQAELILTSLLVKDPQNLDAGMMLTRLYARDLREPDKAMTVLQRLEKQPYVSDAHIEFARRSISEWSQPPPTLPPPVPVTPPESLDELLRRGFFGTAIERLEAQILEQPQDYDLRLKLMEVHGARCGNFPRAEKILQQMEISPNFNPEQIQRAQAKLREWREAPPAKPNN